jgi:hypothetical protein
VTCQNTKERTQRKIKGYQSEQSVIQHTGRLVKFMVTRAMGKGFIDLDNRESFIQELEFDEVLFELATFFYKIVFNRFENFAASHHDKAGIYFIVLQIIIYLFYNIIAFN